MSSLASKYSSLFMLTGVGALSTWPSLEFSRVGASIDGRLARLMGLEKLVMERMALLPPKERSEWTDGERGGCGGGMYGERGGVLQEKLLLDEGFRGMDGHDASRRPDRSSSGLSDVTDRMLDTARANGGLGGLGGLGGVSEARS